MNPLSDGVLDHLRRMAAAPDLDGTRYELGELIGRGGMGVVYMARDRVLDRRVAIKISDEGTRAIEEAKTIALLEHPGIVPIHDAGPLPDGRFYYAMKFVEGRRLDAYAAGPAPLADRLRVFQKVCEAAGYAHSRGVIHRDLKPANIMIGAFGEVYVLDWGVAVAGTPGYMAPEQMRGEAVDARADIHALGAVLRDLLGAGAPAPLRAAIAKAMHADREARYPSAVELIADIDRYLDRRAVSAYREPVAERVVRFVIRNQVLLGLLAAYVAVRFALYFFFPRG